ncbi:hypothetical protein EDB87DRAFT_1574953 [Lactarius vividus]|nr:hypothetical protein EDB87DRAFT_1574953 [Lactarius vividus]
MVLKRRRRRFYRTSLRSIQPGDEVQSDGVDLEESVPACHSCPAPAFLLPAPTTPVASGSGLTTNKAASTDGCPQGTAGPATTSAKGIPTQLTLLQLHDDGRSGEASWSSEGDGGGGVTEHRSVSSSLEMRDSRTSHNELRPSDACAGAKGIPTQLTLLQLRDDGRSGEASWSSEGDGGGGVTKRRSVSSSLEMRDSRTSHNELRPSDACAGAKGIPTQLTPLQLRDDGRSGEASWSSEGDGGGGLRNVAP